MDIIHNNMRIMAYLTSEILTNVASAAVRVFLSHFKSSVYWLFLYKSLYLFGSSVFYSTEVSASRTQTLKTDYCITSI